MKPAFAGFFMEFTQQYTRFKQSITYRVSPLNTFLAMPVKKNARSFLTFLFCLFMADKSVAQSDDSLLVNLLRSSSSQQVSMVLSNPDKYRLQIIYTEIIRNMKGVPSFKQHQFHLDPPLYFNPASMVKMPLAFLSLEKLNRMKVAGVNKYTAMSFDSSYEKQVALSKDLSSQNGKPSIAHFIKRAFLISENDPYNRMYQFLGQGSINRLLRKKEYRSARITREFMGYTEDQNRHTNAVRFYNDDNKEIYYQPPAFNKDSFHFPTPILIGDAHINRNEELVSGPFDFTRHNNISLEDMQQMLKAVIFPEAVRKKQRFDLTNEDRLFLLQYLSQYPSETNYPNYDEKTFYDSYVKFFFKDSSKRMPEHVRVFNKVGWAYGFLTDVSYVLDTIHGIDYFLSATLYVNSDGVVNDSKYDEETIGFPFLRELGRLVYDYELQQKRQVSIVLKNPVPTYEKRAPEIGRTTIKEADN